MFRCYSKSQVNSLEMALCIVGMPQSYMTTVRYSCAPTKFEPKSDQQMFGWPWRHANRRNAIEKASDDFSVMSSRWIALVVVQVKITTWASRSVLRFNLTCSDPNMSIAVFENGGNPTVTRKLGTWPTNWSRGFLRNFQQRTQLLKTALAIFLSTMIQYFRLASCIRLFQPQCPRLCCRWRKRRIVSWWSLGNTTGFLMFLGRILAFSRRPWALVSPSSSILAINFLPRLCKFMCFWLHFKSCNFECMSSWTVREPFGTSLCLTRSTKRYTYARVLWTFLNVEHFSNRWEKMQLSSCPSEADVAWTFLVSSSPLYTCFGVVLISFKASSRSLWGLWSSSWNWGHSVSGNLRNGGPDIQLSRSPGSIPPVRASAGLYLIPPFPRFLLLELKQWPEFSRWSLDPR